MQKEVLSNDSPSDFPSQGNESRFYDSRVWVYAVLILLLLGTFRLFSSPSPILGMDWPAWWSFVEQYKTTVSKDQGIFSKPYFMGISGGSTCSSFYSFPILVPWLLSFWFSSATACKIALVGTIMFTYLSIYLFLRLWSSRGISALTALPVLMSVLVLINDGMWYNILSVGMSLLFVLFVIRFWENGANYGKFWLFAVFTLALTPYAHPIGSIFGGGFWCLTLMSLCFTKSRPPIRKTIAFLAIPFLAVCFSYMQIGAASEIVSKSIVSHVTTDIFAPAPLRVRPLNYEQIVFFCIFILGLPSLYTVLKNRAWVFWNMVLLYVFFYIWHSNLINYVPFRFPFQSQLVAYSLKAIIYVRVLGLFSGLSIFIWWISFYLPQIACGKRRQFLAFATRLVFLVGIAGFSFCYWFLVIHKTFDDGKERDDYIAVESFLRDNVPYAAERVFFENPSDNDTYYAERKIGSFSRGSGGSHAFAFMGPRVPVYQVGEIWLASGGKPGCYSKNDRILGFTSDNLSENEFKERMRWLSCGFIVVVSKRNREALEKLPFLQKTSFGRYSVFHDPDFVTSWGFDSDNPEKLFECTIQSSNRLTVSMGDRDSSVKNIVISFFYSSGWKASIDGTPLKISTWNGLMQVSLPQNEMSGDIQFEYSTSDTSGVVALTLGAALCLFILPYIYLDPNRKITHKINQYI